MDDLVAALADAISRAIGASRFAGLESSNIEGLLRPVDVAKMLGVARPTIYKLISCELLPSVQWSANGERPTVRIRPADLRDFIENHRRPTT